MALIVSLQIVSHLHLAIKLGLQICDPALDKVVLENPVFEGLYLIHIFLSDSISEQVFGFSPLGLLLHFQLGSFIQVNRLLA